MPKLTIAAKRVKKTKSDLDKWLKKHKHGKVKTLSTYVDEIDLIAAESGVDAEKLRKSLV